MEVCELQEKRRRYVTRRGGCEHAEWYDTSDACSTEECGHVYGRGLTQSMHLGALKAAVGPSRIFAKIREERQTAKNESGK